MTWNFGKRSRTTAGYLLYGSLLAVTPLLVHQAKAQLGPATAAEDKIGRPSPFAGPVGHEPPSTNPRDFSGMWRNAPRPKGGPGGPGGPGGAAGGKKGPGKGGPGGAAFALGRATSRYCIPSTMILAGGEAGTDILQTPSELRVVTEEQHNNRRIYINAKHSDPLVRSVNGDSIAHWDGNTLVIETTGFIGYGVSPTLVRTEQLSKSADGATLTDVLTYADPSGQPTPKAQTAKMIWWPGQQVLEYICEDGAQRYMQANYK